MIDLYSYIVEKIYMYVPGPKNKKGHHSLNFRCPVCGDSKQNLSKKRGWLKVNPKTNLPSFSCWNCDARMGAYQFIAFLENKTISEVKKEILYSHKESFGLSELLNQHQIEDAPGASPVTLDHPPPLSSINPLITSIEYGNDWIDYQLSEDAKTIVESRRILQAPFCPKNWKLYYDKKSNRLVIPWIRNGEMTYYQLRSLVKSPQKYLFPAGKTKDVFGLDSIDESFSYIFYCEGVFDSIFCKNAIAIGGLSLSEYQQTLVNSRFPLIEHLVFFPDNQWCDESAMRQSLKIVEAGQEVFIWPREITEKDVNEYVIKYQVNPFENPEFMKQHVYSGLKALVKLRFKR